MIVGERITIHKNRLLAERSLSAGAIGRDRDASRLISDLRPAALDDIGAQPAIKDLVTGLS